MCLLCYFLTCGSRRFIHSNVAVRDNRRTSLRRSPMRLVRLGGNPQRDGALAHDPRARPCGRLAITRPRHGHHAMRRPGTLTFWGSACRVTTRGPSRPDGRPPRTQSARVRGRAAEADMQHGGDASPAHEPDADRSSHSQVRRCWHWKPVGGQWRVKRWHAGGYGGLAQRVQ